MLPEKRPKVSVEPTSIHEIGTEKDVIFVTDVKGTYVLNIITTYAKSVNSAKQWIVIVNSFHLLEYMKMKNNIVCDNTNIIISNFSFILQFFLSEIPTKNRVTNVPNMWDLQKKITVWIEGYKYIPYTSRSRKLFIKYLRLALIKQYTAQQASLK